MAGEYGSVRRQRGATVVEYALIVALIALAVLVTVVAVGKQLDIKYSEIAACVQNPATACTNGD